MEKNKQKPKRPALVLAIIVLATLAFLISTLAFLVNALAAFTAREVSVGLLTMTLILLWNLLVAIFSAFVAWSSWSGRSWGRPLAIIFALALPALIFYLRLSGGKERRFEIANDELMGAAIAELAVTALVLIFPLMFIISKKVKLFYKGVDA